MADYDNFEINLKNLFEEEEIPSYCKCFWYCDVHDDIYYSICDEIIEDKEKSKLTWRIDHKYYPKNQDYICHEENDYSCHTVFIGYRIYSDDDMIIEDSTYNFDFNRRDTEYLREYLESSELVEHEEICNYKAARKI